MVQRLIFGALIGLNSSSCGTSSLPGGLNRSSGTGIFGGQELTESDALSKYVVGLYDEDNHSRCTGSVIASDIILTAAHCVDPQSHKLDIVFSPHIFEGSELNNSKITSATRFMRHPKFDTGHEDGVITYDLALIYFSGGLPAGYKVLPLDSDFNRWTQDAARSEVDFLALGYGISNRFFESGGGILRQAKVPFESMHSASEFRIHQIDSGVCSGDSGGPALIENSGQWIQVGVASRVINAVTMCRGSAVYTRTDVYKTWIEQTAGQLRAAVAPEARWYRQNSFQ
jgi:hypothetical protein